MKLRTLKYNKVLFVIWLCVLIAWTAFIFSNSLTVAAESTDASQGVVDVIEALVQKFVTDFQISGHLVRKLAHFIEFFILSWIFILSYYIFVTDFKYHICLSLFFGLFVSLVDETLQLFSNGRASMIKDVWLDFFAVITSVLLFSLINYIINRKKSL